ncbi:lymphocyte antigen 6E-like [Dromiciops gliroides]|uniref:lymphocyte antigen 6E-like n=1 Tax=Dromiciops gliroides TaxID=33562 RepID=UPI001CC55933|nr:lymphocyte antigen 6E-like [Dromiciops gliroides]
MFGCHGQLKGLGVRLKVLVEKDNEFAWTGEIVAGELVWTGDRSDSFLLCLRDISHQASSLGLKVFVLVLLAALLFVEQAHALLCFTCEKEKGIIGCLKISLCSVDEIYCISQRTFSKFEDSIFDSRQVLSCATLSRDAFFIFPEFHGIHGMCSCGGHRPKTISKFCSSFCPGKGYVSAVTIVNTRCCRKTLCNTFSSDGGLQASFLVLGLSVLLSLLYILGRPSA